MLLTKEQMTGYGHDFLQHWDGEELFSRQRWKVWKMLRTLLSGEKYSATLSVWFQEFVMESLGMVRIAS